MRLARCEVRDHFNYRKNGTAGVYRFYRALQRLKIANVLVLTRYSEPRDFRVFQHNLPEADIVLYAMRVSKKKSASGLTSEFIATCSEFTCSPCCLTYSYAACSRSRSGVDEFTSIRERRQRFAKIVQCLAAHDAIARGKPHIYEMLEEGVQSWQKLFFSDAISQSKYATEANRRNILHLLCPMFPCR